MRRASTYYPVFILGAIMTVVVIMAFAWWPNSNIFLAQVSDKQDLQLIRDFLNKSHISYHHDHFNIYLKTKIKNKEKLVGKILRLKGFKKGVLLEKKENLKNLVAVENYHRYFQEVLKVINPYLDYKITSAVKGLRFNEKIFQVEVKISNVVKRDNLQEIVSIVQSGLRAMSSGVVEAYDDQGKKVLTKTWGSVKNNLLLEQKIIGEIHKLLAPVLDIKNTYVLVNWLPDERADISVLIDDENILSAKENEILKLAVENKIKVVLGVTGLIEIKNINKLSRASNKSIDDLTIQNKFLYLLLLTVITLGIYLLGAIYFKNKQKYLKLKRLEKEQKENKEEKKAVEKKITDIIIALENQILHRTDNLIKAIESYLKEMEGLAVENQYYSSGEICSILISELTLKSKKKIYHHLSPFLVDKIISYGSHENIKAILLEDKFLVLDHLRKYLENKTAIIEFRESEGKKDHTSQAWHDNPYVELIKKSASRKDYHTLINFFEKENPKFTSLVFVSLNEKFQYELWKMFTYEQKEKMILSLVCFQNIDEKSLEHTYNCFKLVG